ncbi:hypothetical protein Leryth_001908 [Lithospermum erythrorhizon]|nr:hypothetical protein Leryth_001908 [Lithospermum erythrorhizon]
MTNYSHIWLICLLLLPLMCHGDIEPTMPDCEQGGLQGSQYICLATETQPYRTAYHFQPAKNWMNGNAFISFTYGSIILAYIIFCDIVLADVLLLYNPSGAVWIQNISWGHSTSTDLVNWTPQPIAMWPSHAGDINGCFSGSATILPGEVPAMLYTGINSKNEQVQNLALPKDLSDPYLIEWVKSQHNPLMIPGSQNNIDGELFRDPSTAWLGNDGHWRVAIGITRNRTGAAIIYKSKDFIHWTMDVEQQLHSTKDTGMWECVDFFPVATSSLNGLDTSTTGYGTRHVLKSSMYDIQYDYYTIGIYDTDKDIFMPDMDFPSDNSGLRFDYGRFYASKTFYDSSTNRRILWGWVKETTDTATDIMKGWSGLQVDHSIVESFGGRGKTSMTARIYPTLAVESVAHLYAFNNGMESVKISTLSAWSMKTAQIG